MHDPPVLRLSQYKLMEVVFQVVGNSGATMPVVHGHVGQGGVALRVISNISHLIVGCTTFNLSLPFVSLNIQFDFLYEVHYLKVGKSSAPVLV